MGKRQRSEASDENDVSVNCGKRSSSEFGRPFCDNISPVITVTGSSQSDSDVDVVWGHSPPPLNLKLCSTPGPKTRRRSDFSSKDIADMIECVNSRNNSQQSPIISTPPLLGLWMQGRQEVDTTPVIARNEHRALRRIPSRRPSNDTWALLAKDLHMLAEQSQTAKISDLSLDADSNNDEKDDIIAGESDNEDKPGDVQPPVDDESCKLTSELCSQVHQEVKCQNLKAAEEPMEELWEDDSWFENESFVKLATQVEEQAFSQKPQEDEAALMKALAQDRGACVLGKAKKDSSNHFDETNRSKQLKDVKSQLMSPPKVNQMSLKKTFHSSPSEGKPSVSDRSSFKFPQIKQSQTKLQRNASQFQKKVLPPSTSEQWQAACKEGVPSMSSNASSKVVSQFEKKRGRNASNESYHKNNFSTQSSATVVVEVKTPTSENDSAARNALTSKENQQVVDHDCSIDLFESSATEDGQGTAITTLVHSKDDGDFNRKNLQIESKVNSSPGAKDNKQESDLFSESSLLDEELLAAVEKEEEQWDLVYSQQTGKANSSNVGTGGGKAELELPAKEQFHSISNDNRPTQNFHSKPTKSPLLHQTINISKKEITRQVSNFKAPTCSNFTFGSKSSTLRGKGNSGTSSQFCHHVEDMKTSQRSNLHSDTSNSLHCELSVASNSQTPAPSTGQLVSTISTNTFVSSQSSGGDNVANNPRVRRSTFQFGKTQKSTANPTPLSEVGPQRLKETHDVKMKSNEFIHEEVSDVAKLPSEAPTRPLLSQFPSKVLLGKGAAGSDFNTSYLSQSSQFSSGSQFKTQDDENCLEVTPSPVFKASKSSVNCGKPPQTSAPSIAVSKSRIEGQGNDGNGSSSKCSVASKEHMRTGEFFHGQSSQCIKIFADKSQEQPFLNKVVSSSVEPTRKASVHGQSSQFMKAVCHKSSDSLLAKKVSSSSDEPLNPVKTNLSLHGQSSRIMRALHGISNDGSFAKKEALASTEPFKHLRKNFSHQSSQFIKAAGDKLHAPTLADKSSPSKESLGKNVPNKCQSSQFVKVSDGRSHGSLLKKETCTAPSSHEPQAKCSATVAFQSCASDGKMGDMDKSRQQGTTSFQFRKTKKIPSQSCQNPSRSSKSTEAGDGGEKPSKDTISVATHAGAISVGHLMDSSMTSSGFCQFNSSHKEEGLVMETVSGQGQESPQMVKTAISSKARGTRSDISGLTNTTEKLGDDKDGNGLIALSQDLTKRTCSQEEIERKRMEALARKKEKVIVNHRMSLRIRSMTKKS